MLPLTFDSLRKDRVDAMTCTLISPAAVAEVFHFDASRLLRDASLKTDKVNRPCRQREGERERGEERTN